MSVRTTHEWWAETTDNGSWILLCERHTRSGSNIALEETRRRLTMEQAALLSRSLDDAVLAAAERQAAHRPQQRSRAEEDPRG